MSQVSTSKVLSCLELLSELLPPDSRLPKNAFERTLQLGWTHMKCAHDYLSFCENAETISQDSAYWADCLNIESHAHAASVDLAKAYFHLDVYRRLFPDVMVGDPRFAELHNRLREAVDELQS